MGIEFSTCMMNTDVNGGKGVAGVYSGNSIVASDFLTEILNIRTQCIKNNPDVSLSSI